MKFNLDLFKINNTKTKHYNFLIFLIRKLYGKSYNGKINRKEFIILGIEKGYKKKTIEQFFDQGIKNNPYIIDFRYKRDKKFYYIKNYINKENPFSIIIDIPNKILDKINNISDFYTLSFAIIASRLIITNDNIKDIEYNKIRGRTLRTIGKMFGGLAKNSVYYHIKKASDIFEGFSIKNRYTTYNGYICQISSLYFFEGIEQKIIKNTINNKKTKSYTNKNIKINNKKYIFGELKDFQGFLPTNIYNEEGMYNKILNKNNL